jgi:hypothetical protein
MLYGYSRQKIKDRGSEESTGLRDKQEYLRNLQSAFVDASGQFNIIAAVASAARMRQHPPFFEAAFLQSIAEVQFLGMFSVSFTSNVAVSKPRDSRRVTALCLYMSLLFGFFMEIQFSLQASESSADVIQELAVACPAYGRIWLGIAYPILHGYFYLV